MNITVEVPRFGYGATAPVEMQREDHLRTRIVQGNGSELLPVPGLLAVERVRFRGGEHEAQITRELPVDQTMRNFFTPVIDAYYLERDVDGMTYLVRHPWCNDGKWQDGSSFWVTGTYDETINPPSGALAAPPETQRRPLLTSGPEGVAEQGSRPGRKSAAQIAAEAEAAGVKE